MTRRPVLATFILAIAAAGFGWLLVPGPHERVTMLTRDGLHDDALALAQTVSRTGGDPILLYRLAELNGAYGDPRVAGAAAAAYLRERPQDVAGWRLAAHVADGVGDTETLLHALERVVALASDAAALDRLVRLHRLHHDAASERRLLASLPTSLLAPAHLERLADLCASDGEMERAADALARYDAVAPPRMRAGRLKRFQALLALGRSREAAALARGWLATWQAPELEAQMTRLLLRAGADAEALALFDEAMARPGRTLAQLIHILGDERRLDLASPILAKWTQELRAASPARLRRIVDETIQSALDLGLQGPVLQQFVAVAARGGQPLLTALLAEKIHAALGPGALAAVRPLLTGPVLAAHPLFAARLAAQEGDLATARWFLMSFDVADLTAEETPALQDLATDLLSPAERLSLVTLRGGLGRVPAEARPAMEHWLLTAATR